MTPDRAIEATSLLCRTWSGEIVEDGLPIRCFRGSAEGGVLIWVFNAAHEPLALANALRGGHTLYALRSLSQVMRPSDDRTAIARILARRYAEALAPYLPEAPALVGGNCQAAPIALWLARTLEALGYATRSFATIDASLENDPATWPLLSIYGKSYHGRQFPRQTSAAQHKTANIDHDHGTFFDASAIDEVSGLIEAFASESSGNAVSG